MPIPTPNGAPAPHAGAASNGSIHNGGEVCPHCNAARPSGPAPGLPGTAYPYAPPSTFVAPPYPNGFGFVYPFAGGIGVPPGGYTTPWWGYGPGRNSYVPGGGHYGAPR